ncbi:MAG: hypothetical protein C4K49_05380 [Candidatus Thorarchaeota archaeon]|nr:MAG: hypothetical protein C4K49_05380 [Candidatus Thorarchaeota archaeon]
MLKRVEVVVVGAGSAGCVTAHRCAEMGLKTLLLDRKPQPLVGHKVCGDEVSRSHFDATGIEYPQGEEIANIITGADVYPPSMEQELKVRGWTEFDGWMLNRISFGQRLLKAAVSVGVSFHPNCHVNGPVVKDGKVMGVEYREPDTGGITTVAAKLVVDASGFAGVIRSKLDDPLVEKRIAKTDIALCYREYLRLKMPLAEPNVARVFLGARVAPAGYAWVFPRGVSEVNAGIGTTGGESRGSPKSYFLKLKAEYPLLFGSQELEGGGGAVPVRRPLMSLVADGVAFVGDAALQVNPIHGGGIGPGMRAGIILGEVAKEAIARGDVSAEGLWDYNSRFLSDYGRRLASLEIFRRLLQDVSDDDMDFGFSRRLLEAEDLMSANRGDAFSLGIAGKLRRVKRSSGRLGLLLKLRKAAGLMKKMNKTYLNYPAGSEGFESWVRSVNNILQSAHFE